MSFDILLQSLKTILRKGEGIVTASLRRMMSFLALHYTWVSVIVLGIAGTFIIWLFASLWKYNHYDWWRWKGRAAKRMILFWVILCVAKILLRRKI